MPGIHEGAQSDKDEGREVKKGSRGRAEPGGSEQERDCTRTSEGWTYRDSGWLITRMHRG